MKEVKTENFRLYETVSTSLFNMGVSDRRGSSFIT